jgi:hypothetical protein
MARFRLVSLSSFVAFYQSRSILVGAKAMVLTFLTLLVLVDGGWAQAAPGIVPFSTRAGGNVDSLDLATGAVALNIPVRTKNGKTSLTFSKFGNTFMSTENSGSTWAPSSQFGGSSHRDRRAHGAGARVRLGPSRFSRDPIPLSAEL